MFTVTENPFTKSEWEEISWSIIFENRILKYTLHYGAIPMKYHVRLCFNEYLCIMMCFYFTTRFNVNYSFKIIFQHRNTSNKRITCNKSQLLIGAGSEACLTFIAVRALIRK